jgi:hypothetical protein
MNRITHPISSLPIESMTLETAPLQSESNWLQAA